MVMQKKSFNKKPVETTGENEEGYLRISLVNQSN